MNAPMPHPTPVTHPAPTSVSTRPTLVLLHASGSSSRQWDLLSRALQATHEVHALDLHGHGRRPAWSGSRPLSLHDDARLALEVLERAGGGHVVGHSYGGAVALHLAATHPSRVHSLALYEPAVFSLLAERAPGSAAAREIVAVAQQLRRLIAAGDLAEASEGFVDYWSGAGSWRRMGPEQQRAIAARIATTLAHFDTLIGEPLPGTAGRRLSMPVLVLHGTRTIATAHVLALLMRELLPQAAHEAIPGIGHMGPLTDPARVNERLLRFLGVGVPAGAQAAEALA
ncbi:alpha/beta hydrolase [Piscinibacter sp. XHJ-5]|uniref:alpha/beta fold hydrolase n=1 Tax=Piscinibacter sp. XHJ-5 TaxID=3037797 RepID=UPI00245372C4|nr:alpha/beta hydrolase [Piscinibacter sp. XHJ-5]